MKIRRRCDCGQPATVQGQSGTICERCRRLESYEFAGYKMTESWQERKARKAAEKSKK